MLAPPPDELLQLVYPSLDVLVHAVNNHAKHEGYAVKKRRTKPSEKGVAMKAAIVCDAHGNEAFRGNGIRDASNRRMECPFRCNAKLKDNYEDERGKGPWQLTLITSEHNHPPTGQSAHRLCVKWR